MNTIRPTATAHYSLAAKPESVARARKLLRRVLNDSGVDPDTRAEALLVASELVTNAINHGSRTGDEIVVAYTATPTGSVSIAVTDRVRRGSAPRALPPADETTGGRGLQVVEQLARWSERVLDGRREVRAELSR
jgi:anti-sigma regulatory factor (Ser/Thr protein kinase)